jgi:hypothetical protein
MSLQSAAIRVMIIAGALALYDVWIKPGYLEYLQAGGNIYGYGQSLLGYTAVMIAAWLLGSVMTRRMDTE